MSFRKAVLLLAALVVASTVSAHAQLGVYGMFTVDRLSNQVSSPLPALPDNAANVRSNSVDPLGGTGGVYYDFWKLGPVKIGAFTQFIDDVYQNDVFDANNNKFIVKGQTTVNLYVQYNFSQGMMKGTSITVGARNIFDKDPPLAPTGGYVGAVYNPYARYLYVNIRKDF